MQVSYEKDHVVIRIPANAAQIANAPMSKSGKSKLVASLGFTQVDGAPDGVKVSFNLIAPK